MKHYSNPILNILIVIVVLGIANITGCREPESSVIPSSDIRLIGKWDINTLITEFSGTTEELTKPELDSMGTVWKFDFMANNSVEQITDYDSTLVNMPGTWTAAGNKLTMQLTIPGGKEGIFEYYYSVNDTSLTLGWVDHTNISYEAGFLKIQ